MRGHMELIAAGGRMRAAVAGAGTDADAPFRSAGVDAEALGATARNRALQAVTALREGHAARPGELMEGDAQTVGQFAAAWLNGAMVAMFLSGPEPAIGQRELLNGSDLLDAHTGEFGRDEVLRRLDLDPRVVQETALAVAEALEGKLAAISGPLPQPQETVGVLQALWMDGLAVVCQARARAWHG